jgi:hypothetical protein
MSKKELKIDVDDIVENFEHIYLLQINYPKSPRIAIYKYGKTTRLHNRFNSYPVDSKIYLVRRVKNCHYVENEIERLFKKYFVHEKTCGREYFSGDCKKLIECIEKVIEKTNQHMDDDMIETRLRAYYKGKFKICIGDGIVGDSDISKDNENVSVTDDVISEDDSNESNNSDYVEIVGKILHVKIV